MKGRVDLVMTGYLGYGYKELLPAIKKHSKGDSIRHLGYVADEDLPALYTGSKMLLFPTLYEGFGLPLLEAFATGTPVLSSNISSVPEVAGDAAMLINPMDVDAIAEGGIKILEDESCSGRLVEAGFKRARLFTWERAARKNPRCLRGTRLSIISLGPFLDFPSAL